MRVGVMFGNIHSERDLGLVMSEKSIGAPEVRTNYIDVPMRDGLLDFTESITGKVKYKSRAISLVFYMLGDKNLFVSNISKIENYLHGKRLKVIFDDDPAYYYDARLSVNEWISDRNAGKVVIEGTAEPYKLDIQSSAEDWLWDPLDFEDGVIRELNSISVNGTATVTLIGSARESCPEFTASAAMTVTYKEKSYNLPKGSTKVYEILVEDGENVLTFKGNGTVSIDYRGGSL